MLHDIFHVVSIPSTLFNTSTNFPTNFTAFAYLVFILFDYIGCSFKFLLKVGVEESIVNAPLVSLQGKNANNVKSEVRLNS
jgi:hypothetical protein